MGKRIKKLKNVRLHREGTNTLLYSGMAIVVIAILLWHCFDTKIPFWIFVAVFGFFYGVVVNFYRCPIRYFGGDYFHDKRLMISIFMSPFNVHANWYPVDGRVKFVHHQDGNYHKAWLPKASEENEHSDVMIETDNGIDVLCRQIAGAIARRIVTYAKPDEDCYIDEHLGFIKLGSRVDVFLPLGSEVSVKMGQSTTGDQTVIAKLK